MQPEAKAGRELSLLPGELAGPAPHPLPRWATRVPALAVTLLTLAALGALGYRTYARVPALALAPAGLAAAGVALLWLRRRQHRFLRAGRPAVGRVDRTIRARGALVVKYTFSAPAGEVRGQFVHDAGNLVRDFGLWPEPGDLVFLVVDPRDPARRAVWGFAQPPGRPPRAPPVLHTPLPIGAVVAVIGGALVLAGATIAWVALR